MQKNSRTLHKKFVAIPFLILATMVAGCSDGADDDDDNIMMITDENDIDPGDDGDDDAIQETINADGTSDFVLELSAEQEAPPLDIETAVADAELVINKTSGAITGIVDWSGLTSSIVAAHIHRGFAGINGPALIALEFVPQDPLVGAPDNINPLQVPAGTSLDSDALAALANGELYINVHTENNESGEIRGQIVPIGVVLEDSELSIEEVVDPAFTSEATGFGVSTVNESTGVFSATVFLSDIDDADAVEIRRGAVGENGEIIMMMLQDGSDASVWRTPETSVLTPAQIDELKDEALYFNVTSPRAPTGEIRGQL